MSPSSVSEAPRPRCSVFIATSVDGYIARADGTIDWLSIVEKEGEDYGFGAFFESVDVLVMGRSTYEVALGFDPWPYGAKRCVVLTHRPSEARHGEEFFSDRPSVLVDRLARDGAKRLYIDGGTVIQQFLAEGLVDDLTISVVPVVLGGGIPLFSREGTERRLVLEDARSWPTGLAQLRYRVAR